MIYRAEITNWSRTLLVPATPAASRSIFSLSSCVLTGPLSVTLPFRVTILTLVASAGLIASAIRLRMSAVIWASPGFSLWRDAGSCILFRLAFSVIDERLPCVRFAGTFDGAGADVSAELFIGFAILLLSSDFLDAVDAAWLLEGRLVDGFRMVGVVRYWPKDSGCTPPGEGTTRPSQSSLLAVYSWSLESPLQKEVIKCGK